MTLLLIGLIRSIVVSAAAGVIWTLARRRSAAFGHWVLVGGILTSAGVVPLSLVMPRWGLLPERVTLTTSDVFAVTSPPEEAAPATGNTTPAPVVRAGWSTPAIVCAVWAVGAVVGLSLLTWRLFLLGRLTSRARPLHDVRWSEISTEIAGRYGIVRPISLRCTDSSAIVATWGLMRPTVLVPSDAGGWDSSWIRVVLAHELAHVSRADWSCQLTAEIVRAVLWPNVLLWALCATLRRESECACDDIVVHGGVAPATYASHLVEIAHACRGTHTALPALSMAGASTLERRVTMLLTSDRDRRLPRAWAVSLLMIGMLVLGGTVASVGLVAQTVTGTLTGHVYDPSGAVLPGVEVILEDERQVKWPTTTDSSGKFEFTPVGAGKYVLRATLPGFRTLSDSFELRSIRDWNRSVTLQVGELQETVTVTERRPNPRPPATATSATRPVRIGGNIKPPRKIGNTPPVYPAAMRDAGLEGLVPIDALIAVDGTVASVRVLSAQVHPAFARAAEDAVRQWRFSQTLLNGVPVEVQMTVSVQFSLTD